MTDALYRVPNKHLNTVERIAAETAIVCMTNHDPHAAFPLAVIHMDNSLPAKTIKKHRKVLEDVMRHVVDGYHRVYQAGKRAQLTGI